MYIFIIFKIDLSAVQYDVEPHCFLLYEYMLCIYIYIYIYIYMILPLKFPHVYRRHTKYFIFYINRLSKQ
jgi:hypothetical protein